MVVGVYHSMMHVSGEQDNLRCRFSSSAFTWVPELKLKVSGLYGKHCTGYAILPAPSSPPH